MRCDLSRRQFLMESAVAFASTALLADCGLRDDVAGAASRLASAMHGQFLRPTDVAYENARKVWNAAVEKRPRFIAKCADVSDVQRCLEFAVQHSLAISVRAGGHHPAGTSLVDSGLVLDLSPMKDVRVDPLTRRVTVQPGVVFRQLYTATQSHGLAVPAGTVSTVGVSGLTLGGGEGWLISRYGLTCDNLVAADVLTADGRRLRVTAEENPDLFWGLRGGGGNFGIVTSFEYDSQPVPDVVTGGYTYEIGDAADALRAWRDHAPDEPDEITSLAALVRTPDPVLNIAACYDGTDRGASEALKAFDRKTRIAGGFSRKPLLETMSDVGSEPGFRYHVTSLYLPALTDAAVAIFLDQFQRTNNETAVAFLWHFHGAFSRTAVTDTAYSHRNAKFMFGCILRWAYPGEDSRHVQWARDFKSALQEFSTGEVYGNFIGETDATWARAAYGANYDRLSTLKRVYDPTNIFRSNVNVPPTA